jgi:polyhydroxyalkanoate synthesis regulator phasin
MPNAWATAKCQREASASSTLKMPRSRRAIDGFLTFVCYLDDKKHHSILRKEAAMADIFDFAKKTMLTGIGLALLAKDEMEEIAKDIVEKGKEKGKLTEEEAKKFWDDLHERYDDVQKKLEDKVEQNVKEILDKMKIVTEEKLEGKLKAIKKDVNELKKAVSQESKPSE